MRRIGFRLLLVSGLTAITLYGSAFADYTMREDVRDYIAEVSAEHDFDEAQERLKITLSIQVITFQNRH